MPLRNKHACISVFYVIATLLGFIASTGCYAEVLRQSSLWSRASEETIKRSITPTDVCKRWSQQSAVINGTIYLYGGRATTSDEQTTNQWNNDFLTLDLTKSWQISAPLLTGLPKPSGPPEVANGYLWASYNSLYLYGGEYQDKPITYPAPFSLWEYQIEAQQWIEHSDPITSAGENSPSDGEPVERAAEGAGFSVAALGRGWYFGGHEDQYTMVDWTYMNGRVYLSSLLEYTFPGYPNQDVKSLTGGATAGSEGVWRNITQASVNDQAGFPERADGVIVWVPGYGEQGILLGLMGGDEDTFTQTNIIDVYDVASSTWYKQSTSGSMPKPRVNPCAVVAAAADGSSYNVYLYGGQDLLPAGNQEQYSDIWILTLPTFTWIPVSQSGQSMPPARAGHTCNVWDAQMVVVGGYVSSSLSCDAPGTYVFDLSTATWVPEFTRKSDSRHNPFSRQSAQMQDPMAMQGSYSYAVPSAVQAVVGGGPSGGASLTAPAVPADAGPIATGKPKTYPLPPGSGGLTGNGDGDGGSGSNSSSGSDTSSSTNVGAIVAGVVAGLLFLVLLYLAFVAYLYRKRLAAYKRNVDEHGWTPSKEGQGQRRRRARERRGRYYAAVNGRDGGAEERGGGSSSPDSLAGREPTFVGIMLSPRRSLRVTNPD